MKTIDRKRSSEFTLGHIFVIHSSMKTCTLISSALFMAISAFGGSSSKENPSPSSGADFTPIFNSHHKLAHISINFCDDGDMVIENFYLGKSKDAHNHIYLYEQETVFPTNGAPPSPTTWVRCNEPLDCCTELFCSSKDSDCDSEVIRFTRPIYTGHGEPGEKADPGCKPVIYYFSGHDGNISYTYKD
jgi:hypothetical protein